MRPLRWPALLAAALLAGCVAPAAEQLGPASVPLPEPLTWGARDCAFAIAGVRVEAARLAPYLPEGFSPAQGLLPALPPPGPQFATLALDVYACEAGHGLLDTRGPVVYGSFYTPVVPPRGLQDEDGRSHFVKWDTLVQNPAGREALQAAGLPAHDGEGAVELPPLVLGGPVRARLAMEAGGFEVVGSLIGPPETPLEVPYVEFTPTSAGSLATWWATAKIEGSLGTATLRLAPGSWVADVVGSEVAAGTLYAGRWTIHDATVALP